MAFEPFSSYTVPGISSNKKNGRDMAPSSNCDDNDVYNHASENNDGEAGSEYKKTKENGGNSPFATLHTAKPGSRLKRGSVLKTFQIRSKDKDSSQSSSSALMESSSLTSNDSQVLQNANGTKLPRPPSGSNLRKTFRNSIRNPFRTRSENTLQTSTESSSIDETIPQDNTAPPVAGVDTPKLEAFSFEASLYPHKTDNNESGKRLSVPTTLKPAADCIYGLGEAKPKDDAVTSGLGHYRSPSSSYPSEGVRTPPDHPKSPPRTYKGYAFDSFGQDMLNGLSTCPSSTKVLVHNEQEKRKEETEIIPPSRPAVSVDLEVGKDHNTAVTLGPATGTSSNPSEMEPEKSPAMTALLSRTQDLVTVMSAAHDLAKENGKKFFEMFRDRPEGLDLYFPRIMGLEREMGIDGTTLDDEGMSEKYFHAIMKDFLGALGVGGLEGGSEQLSVLGRMLWYKRELHVAGRPEEMEAWRLLTTTYTPQSEDEMMERFENSKAKSDLGSAEEFRELREMDPALAQLFLAKIEPEINRVLNQWWEAGLYQRHELQMARGGPRPWRIMQHKIIVQHLPWLWVETHGCWSGASKARPQGDQHGKAESSSTLVKSPAGPNLSELSKGRTEVSAAPTLDEIRRDMPTKHLHPLNGMGAPLERTQARKPFDTNIFAHDLLHYWRRLLANTSEGGASASSLRVLTSHRSTASHSSLPPLSVYPNPSMSRTNTRKSFSNRFRRRVNRIVKRLHLLVPVSLNQDD
jgi:hypothetical protein